MEVLTACRTAKCLEMKNHNEMVMSCPLISRNRPESEIKFWSGQKPHLQSAGSFGGLLLKHLSQQEDSNCQKN